MKRIAAPLVLLALSILQLSGQIVHPWHVVDNGGGKSASGTMRLQTSIGQAATTVVASAPMTLEQGYLPGIRFLSGSLATLDLPYEGGWNMVSVPFVVADPRKTVLYPGGSSNAFAYQGSYVPKDSLTYGVGYWIKFPSSGSGHFAGTSLVVDTIPVNDKWNMIGCLTYPLLTSDIHPLDTTTLVSNYWGYGSASGYFNEDTLKPGKSYWIKVHNAGRLAIATGSVLISPGTKGPRSPVASSTADRKRMNVLTVRDARGSERTIYYVPGASDADQKKWEMPPVPFDGMFDVRFASNRMLEAADEVQRKEVPIRIASASYPVIISWSVPSNRTGASLTVGGKKYSLESTGEARVQSQETAVVLSLAPASGRELPATYALHQNYPNPFNPVTTIRYDLPQESHVRIVVYDAIGREIRVIASENQEAGFKAAEWNGTNENGVQVASGMYFYRIETAPVASPSKTYTDVRKMLLLR